MCKNIDVNACLLKEAGISTGKYPNSNLTLFQVLVTLDKIENVYERIKNETK